MLSFNMASIYVEYANPALDLNIMVIRKLLVSKFNRCGVCQQINQIPIFPKPPQKKKMQERTF